MSTEFEHGKNSAICDYQLLYGTCGTLVGLSCFIQCIIRATSEREFSSEVDFI